MRITLGRVAVELRSESPTIAAHWERASQGIAAAGGADSLPGRIGEPEIVIRLEEGKELPAPPDERPFYAGQATGLPAAVSGLTVHRRGQARELFFSAGAWAGVHFLGEAARPAWRVDCLLRPDVLARGRLDDVFFTALAAPLRHFGVYLVHGFGATYRGRALLLLGPSGSGKTTAGVSLLAAGWQFMGNDVVALQAAGGTIQALPTPSLIGVLHVEKGDPAAREYQLDATAIKSWGQPSPVAGVLFMEPGGPAGKGPEAVNQAVAVARLMASSLDRWDEQAVGGHIAFLERLASQAPGYRLAPADVGSYAAESFAAT
jgi:hypothetical protein